jgi:peptidoglycan hydrolase-like protein with peptidoglycan-binding domain
MKSFLERQLVRLLLSRGGPLLQKLVTGAAAAAVTYIASKTGLDVASLGLNEAVLTGVIWGVLDIAVTKLPANILKDYGKQIQKLLNTYGRGTPVKVDGYVGPVTVAAVADDLLATR